MRVGGRGRVGASSARRPVSTAAERKRTLAA
jgi:hypothetical protein